MDAMSAMHTTTTQLLPLAKELDENKVTPGVLGFVVFAVMGVAVWGLMKSMNRHMGKVDFAETAGETAGAAHTTDSGPAGSSVTAAATSSSGDDSGSGDKGPGTSA